MTKSITTWHTITVLAAAFMLAWLCATAVRAAPEAELWPRWTAHDAESEQTIDHGAWNAFLAAYVVEGGDGINRLRYGAVSETDRQTLDAYIDRLADTAISQYDRAEQFAFWINLYNALTVKVILDSYPVESIRNIDISPGLFASGPWGAELITIEGTALTLDDIEHRILRPIWQDPRVHYAVNCASIGCPNLQPKAFTAANTDALLNQGAREYINHPRGFSVGDRGRVRASAIYKWFAEDFGGSERAVLDHARKFAAPPLNAKLEEATGIAGYDYDWSLNDAANPDG